MPKAGNIVYEIDKINFTVNFVYDGVEVKLPITVGQGARELIVAYLDKVQRGTLDKDTTKPKADKNNKIVLKILRNMWYEIYRYHSLNPAYKKLLYNTLATKKYISEELRNEVKATLQLLRFGVYNTMEDRDDAMILISCCYDMFEPKRVEGETYNGYVLVKAPALMQDWPVK